MSARTSSLGIELGFRNHYLSNTLQQTLASETRGHKTTAATNGAT